MVMSLICRFPTERPLENRVQGKQLCSHLMQLNNRLVQKRTYNSCLHVLVNRRMHCKLKMFLYIFSIYWFMFFVSISLDEGIGGKGLPMLTYRDEFTTYEYMIKSKVRGGGTPWCVCVGERTYHLSLSVGGSVVGGNVTLDMCVCVCVCVCFMCMRKLQEFDHSVNEPRSPGNVVT